MASIRKIPVSTGIFWVEVPGADVRILCGCPADAVKHLLRKGLIVPVEIGDVACETGPNAILLSDLMIQNGRVCNQSEFPVLQMLYNQGMIVPGHPGNTGSRPLLIGSHRQLDAQMAYIFRGNYGLASREELMEAGVAPEQVDGLMRMKLAFAFGRIRPSDELVQPVYVEREPVEIRNGVFVRRLRTNVFEISYGEEKVEVNLNLAPGAYYECAYTLDKHLLQRDYFTVVHTGDGDGWDMNRPTMGSIILFQGRVFLIDAGPNISYVLTALGIGVNEIDGIFHSHCHDDHLAGLTTLIRGERRIAYYAVPMVRASVIKKLASMAQISEHDFNQLFEVHDLTLEEWNDIEGLEIKPILSPHPVETTIFYFRVMWEGGYRVYGHLADIASFDVLRKMITSDGAPTGISQALFDKTVEAYRQKADVKKIDIGGGLIHGAAVDFRDDPSGKLILAHTARRLTEEERTIGSGAPFGTVDVLIEGISDDLRRRAFGYLRDYFPDAPLYRIRHLMNSRILIFNPEFILIKEGQRASDIYLILSGTVEMLRTGIPGGSLLSAGSLIGETPALLDTDAGETYRAVSFVQAMRLPRDLYLDFVTRNDLYRDIVDSRDEWEFLRSSWLFADGVSCMTLNRLVRETEPVSFARESVVPPPNHDLLVIRSGQALLTTPAGYEERLTAGSYFGATALAHDAHRGTVVRFLDATEAYRVPLDCIVNVPVVRWKILEMQRRRYEDY
ncbi:MAG: cyclic nucleotide-binding domain-containing protein [Betaproteobacteria bacterium]|nr:cyclic nucleotide-binding domain-containing protein [Betaproteobacteria bacterium]